MNPLETEELAVRLADFGVVPPAHILGVKVAADTVTVRFAHTALRSDVGALDVLIVLVGLVALAAFVLLWRRFPRRRVQLVLGAVALAGAAVFAVWWVLFRHDDPSYAAAQDRAHDAQKALDDALGKDF